jgi:hypothetical protein
MQVALTKLRTAPAYTAVNINGRMHWALFDNHASGNIMSLQMAMKMDLDIEGGGVPFRMIDNSIELSLGHVWVDCSLASAGVTKRCKFHVFATSIRPLIFGGPFLYETGILMAPSTRQTKNAAFDVSLLSIFSRAEDVHQYSLYLVNVEFVNLGKCATCLAVADIGADAELMSLSFACENGFLDQNLQGEQPMIRIGNGKHVRSRGSIDATISLVSGQKQVHSLRRCRFVVVENLPYATILSRDFVNCQNLLKLPDLLVYHHISTVKQHTCFGACNCGEWVLRNIAGKRLENRNPHQKSFKNAKKKVEKVETLSKMSKTSARDDKKQAFLKEARSGYYKAEGYLEDACNYGKPIHTCHETSEGC